MSEEQNQNSPKPARSYWKFVAGFLAIIVAVIAGLLGWQKYDLWRRQIPKGFEETVKKLEQEDYQRAMADTYGGKTPQETLQMYIDAVEKGDYELASKYFIGDYQERELRSLKDSKQENIKYMVDILRKVKLIDLRAKLAQMYDEEVKEHNTSESKEDYINRLYQVWDYDKKAWMDTKVDGYDFSVSFKKYPNGIWKIIEI